LFFEEGFDNQEYKSQFKSPLLTYKSFFFKKVFKFNLLNELLEKIILFELLDEKLLKKK
jgi:hypothetical protein